VDPISRRDLWLIVHEMVEEGVTAVVSTAYLDEAERFDRVALLHRGRLLALDAPARLQASLAGEMLVVEVESARAARELLGEHAQLRKATLFGDKLHVLTDSAEAATPEIGRVLREAGFVVHDIRRAEASLEDVFIDRMAEGT
jgi:ABC-2 type transport system ATP-binding protein